jgi:hypothetical protein
MKCSIKTLQAIQKLLVADLAQQLEAEGGVSASELEQSLRSSLQAVGQASLGQLLSVLDEQAYGSQEICSCQASGRRIARRPAQVLSVFGWVAYRRSYYQCQGCGRRWTPLDQAQQLRPGRATAPMARLLGLAGISVSFEEARRHIREYVQVEVSVNTLRQETQLIGARQAHREQAWMAQSQDLAHLQRRERQTGRLQRVYGSIDGAFVPIEKEWKEAKLVSWYQVGQRYGRPEPHAQEQTYHISLEEAAAFGQLLWGTAVAYQADRAAELVFVCDGAAWIWKLVEHYFPDALQIVDWYHACQYLYPLAEALFSSEPQQQAWLAEMKELLWEGQVATVIQKCQRLPKKVGELANRLISYYTNNQERMRYADFREQQYFIGSGTVESGCKQIVTMRLKRSGASWSRSGAAATAKARCAWLNDDWDAVTNLPLAV